VNLACPQCKKPAISGIRKILMPGLILICRHCEAELTIKHMFSYVSVLSLLFGVILVQAYPETMLFWLGWAIAISGSTYHLVKTPLKIINAGPNHHKYRS